MRPLRRTRQSNAPRDLSSASTVKKIAILCAGAILLGLGVTATVVRLQATQREWPAKQLQNAATLAIALTAYQQQHGKYPERLSELVDAGLVRAEDYHNLRFRATARAQPEDWLYHRPSGLSDIAIAAPALLFPWDGHAGERAIAYPDGSGGLVGAAKAAHLPDWIPK